jgi:hypothetical protein
MLDRVDLFCRTDFDSLDAIESRANMVRGLTDTNR